MFKFGVLCLLVLLYTDLSEAGPRGRYRGGGRGRGGHRSGGRKSQKIVCRSQFINGTTFYTAACPEPLTACREQNELDIVRGRVWEDGSSIAVYKHYCEQLPCVRVNRANRDVFVDGQCPTGKTCQPLPQDFFGRERLIYRPLPDTTFEARYCQPQICEVTDREGNVVEDTAVDCPSDFTCDRDRWNCRGGQVYLKVNPQTQETEVITGVAVSKCSTTTTVDPNAEYYTLVNSFGQSYVRNRGDGSWWDRWDNPDVVPVDPGNDEDVITIQPIDPR